MRSGAAAGLDGLGADLLKGAWEWHEAGNGKRFRFNVLAEPLAVAFDRALRSGYPPDWTLQPLTSVYKGKGPEDQVGSYRAIQVGCALTKLYSMVLAARLSAFALAAGLQAEGQAGFVHGRCAADHIFVLRHLIDRARLTRCDPGRPRPRLFAGFIDLAAAYDSVPRDRLMRVLADSGVSGPMLATLCGMYWDVRARPKQGSSLGPPFAVTSGVRQGDPLSPLLFNLFLDRIETWLAERVPQAGVTLLGRPTLLRLLLFADDMVLLADNTRDLQALLDALHGFCQEEGLRVNASKSEVVVFGASAWRPPPTQPPFTCGGDPLPVKPEFKYLGITLHSTRGMRAATERLRAAGLRAIWGMHSRCTAYGITDFATRTRMYRALAEPVLTYGSEVWGPDFLSSLEAALHAPLQVVQNDYVRHLGGVRRSVPAQVLCSESCLPPLARSWLRACGRQWDRMATAPSGLLRSAFVSDVALATDTNIPTEQRLSTWSGAWLQAAGWLADEAGGPLRAALQHVHRSFDGPSLPHLSTKLQAAALEAWDKVAGAQWATKAAVPDTVAAAYAAFAPTRADAHSERGFPSSMAHYYRHTSHYRSHEHARALMRLRCCSDPFAASPTLHYGTPTACRRCPATPPETAEHALLDCPAYSHLRAQACFAPLFAAPPPTGARLHAFVRSPDQFALAEYVHACFEDRHDANKP